jgi:putative permease
MQVIRDWFSRHLSNPQLVSLLLLFLLFWTLLTFFTSVFAPVFAAVVVAYLLEGPVGLLERRGLPRVWASMVIWLIAVVTVALIISMLVPQLLRQSTQIVGELPKLANELQYWLLILADRYPTVVSQEQMEGVAGGLSINLTTLRNEVLARTHLLGVGLTYVVVYLILVPLIVFFLIKDKLKIKTWLRSFLPSDIGLISQVWADVDKQLGNYVRGKFIEIVIVWAVTYITFTALGLNYAMLLGAATGFSVLVPWVGATLVTFPVAAVSYTQFGVGPELAYVLIAYGIIQALDGNVLVPLLFSEANDLHPVAIIIAVLFFGMTYGFWGVFFAIPLATVVAAVIKAWPRQTLVESTVPEANTPIETGSS